MRGQWRRINRAKKWMISIGWQRGIGSIAAKEGVNLHHLEGRESAYLPS
jgi:hypothetical protein